MRKLLFGMLFASTFLSCDGNEPVQSETDQLLQDKMLYETVDLTGLYYNEQFFGSKEFSEGESAELRSIINQKRLDNMVILKKRYPNLSSSMTEIRENRWEEYTKNEIEYVIELKDYIFKLTEGKSARIEIMDPCQDYICDAGQTTNVLACYAGCNFQGTQCEINGGTDAQCSTSLCQWQCCDGFCD